MASVDGRRTKRVSNMKARVSSRYRGSSVTVDAASYVAASGPCADMQLCRLPPPGSNPSALASYTPKISPMYSFMMLRCKDGGRKVGSATLHPGGKVSKADVAAPASAAGLGDAG